MKLHTDLTAQVAIDIHVYNECQVICIGIQMISSAIWNKISTTKFFKDYKKLPQGRVQFVVFETFSVYLFQIAREKSFTRSKSCMKTEQLLFTAGKN